MTEIGASEDFLISLLIGTGIILFYTYLLFCEYHLILKRLGYNMAVMDIVDFTNFFKKYLSIFLISGILVSLIGVLIFFITGENFVTQGSFLLRPAVSGKISKEEIQALDELSSSYTKTVIGLFESPEVKNKVIENLTQDTNFQNLFLLNFKTNVKEISPRLVVLTVVGGSEEESKRVFYAYEREILEITKNLRDIQLFGLERLSDFPLTTKSEKNLVLYFVTGYLIGFFSSLIILFVRKNYEFRE